MNILFLSIIVRFGNAEAEYFEAAHEKYFSWLCPGIEMMNEHKKKKKSDQLINLYCRHLALFLWHLNLLHIFLLQPADFCITQLLMEPSGVRLDSQMVIGSLRAPEAASLSF